MSDPLWIELCSSLHQYFDDHVDFNKVLLGFDGQIYLEEYILVGLDDGALNEGLGELEAPQGLVVQGWVFDSDGNDRPKAYTELGALLKKSVAGILDWSNSLNDVSVSLRIQNDGDSFAPSYSFQITVNASTQVSIPLDDAGDCDIIKALTT